MAAMLLRHVEAAPTEHGDVLTAGTGVDIPGGQA